MSFSQQLISPKLLYLGNPEDLRDGVGDIFARKVMHKNVPEHFLLSRQKKKIKNYGRERFYERILKIFGVWKSVAQAAQQCPKPLFSISRFKKSSALTIDRNV